jgi:peptide chain release factor 2
MRILRSKLAEVEQRRMEEKMGGIHAAKKAIEWGSQIRSYVLAPYRMASDHRTEIKLSNVDAVLDGDLDQFMIAMLLQLAGDPTAAKEKSARQAAGGPEEEA